MTCLVSKSAEAAGGGCRVLMIATVLALVQTKPISKPYLPHNPPAQPI